MRIAMKNGLKGSHQRSKPRNDNYLGFHMASNLKTGLILTLWKGFDFHGKKLKIKNLSFKKPKVSIYGGDCHNKWGFSQVWQ